MINTEFCKDCSYNGLHCMGDIKVRDGKIISCDGAYKQPEYYTYVELMEMHKKVWGELHNQVIIHGLSYLKKQNEAFSCFKSDVFDSLFYRDPDQDSTCVGCIDTMDENGNEVCEKCFLNLNCNKSYSSLYFMCAMCYEEGKPEALDYIKQIRDCGFSEGIDKNSYSNIKKSDISVK